MIIRGLGHELPIGALMSEVVVSLFLEVVVSLFLMETYKWNVAFCPSAWGASVPNFHGARLCEGGS